MMRERVHLHRGYRVVTVGFARRATSRDELLAVEEDDGSLVERLAALRAHREVGHRR